MSIYDWQRLKTQPTETERNRQEQNKRLYDIAAGRIAEETERDSEEFSKFFSDLVVYSRFYEKRDTTAYAQSFCVSAQLMLLNSLYDHARSARHYFAKESHN